MRNKIQLLSKQWKSHASERIVGLFRGKNARLRVSDQLQRKKEKLLLEFWGALNIQTTWRCYKSKKIARLKRKRKDFLDTHSRVIKVAKQTGRPLGSYEQEVKTVELMTAIGLTEERLEKIETKMKFILKPWWKRRIHVEKFNTLPTFIQNRIPTRNCPLPSVQLIERDKLYSFFHFLHSNVSDFKMIHCAWKETTTMTFIKMKVVIKFINAKAKSRRDGGIKHYNLFDLLDVIQERGGSVVPAGKPTYFPKMAVLSPQTWGIWRIPMEHPSPEFGPLPRHGFTLGEDEDDCIEEVDHGPTREELYYRALAEDGIADRSDHGLGGLIGGALLGVSANGNEMREISDSRRSESNWSNVFGSEEIREADELEEEDQLPEVEMPPEKSALEIEKQERKANSLLNMVRRLNQKKKRKRRKKDNKNKDKLDGSDDGASNDSGDDSGDNSNFFSDASDSEEEKKDDDGEIEETASRLMAEMDEMEFDAATLKRNEEDAAHNAHAVSQLPLCTACRVRNHTKREAQRLCHTCNLPYCIECFRLSHRTKSNKFHRWTNYEYKLVTHAAEETKKEQDYDIAVLKHLERINPQQYRRKKQITWFKWTDGLMQIAGQMFLDKDWKNVGELDMGNTIELIRELLKKRAGQMPSVRVAVRNAWEFLEHGISINFTELVQLLPIFDTYFKHEIIEQIKRDGKKDKLGFDPSIFI